MIIPVYGQDHLTHILLEDAQAESDVIDVFIIDNRGNYKATKFERAITRAPSNLGWAGGCNLGLKRASQFNYEAYVLLNNDTRLSPSFFAGLLAAQEETEGGLIGPVYDGYWPQQHTVFHGAARDYVERGVHREASFIDGTCMFIPRKTYNIVGCLDAESFGEWAHGADIDYALRVRQAGKTVVVTELSYLNHVRHATVRSIAPVGWEMVAAAEMSDGMLRKWGVRVPSDAQGMLEVFSKPLW